MTADGMLLCREGGSTVRLTIMGFGRLSGLQVSIDPVFHLRHKRRFYLGCWDLVVIRVK